MFWASRTSIWPGASGAGASAGGALGAALDAALGGGMS